MKTQFWKFKVNITNPKNILDFMHSVLMWFLMLNLPFHFPLKSPGKCSHAKNKKTNKTIPPYISFLVLTISTNTEPKDSICSSPSRNPTFFALLSSQFENPNLMKSLTSYFPKYLWSPKNLVKPNFDLFFLELLSANRKMREIVVVFFFFI